MLRTVRAFRVVALVAALTLSVAACGKSMPTSSASSASTATSASATGNVRVFAASSLTEAFRDLAKTFEADNKGARVELNFAASSALVQQLAAGSPADVIATADDATMKAVTDGQRNDSAPKVFARNQLVLLVEKANPKGITSLADLDKPGVIFVLCAPAVPCGRLGALALQRANVTAKPASLEDNVKGVVSKVALGEADAGIAYATDANASAKDVKVITIPEAGAADLQARYPIAIVKDATNRAAAVAWVSLVMSTRGQRILATHGFLSP
jgi:molybdate transport system substrate-binding protein